MDKGNMPPPPPPGFAPPPPSGFVPPPPPSGFVPPPPPPPYNAPQPNVYVVGSMQFGPDSQRLKCPHCQADISTVVETEANMKTHLFALLLCIIGFWCCAPCPYCMDSCLTKKHYCPSCNAYLGQTTD